MPVHRLHLVLDDVLGPAVWARVETAPGRSRPLEDLAPLADVAPPTLRPALSPLAGRLRRRAQLPGGRRVPVRPLTSLELLGLLGAAREHLAEAREEHELMARLGALAESGASLHLADELVAMPDLLAGILAEDASRALVDARRLLPVITDAQDVSLLRWVPLSAGGTPFEDPLLAALVDARARLLLDEVRAADADTAAPVGGELPGAEPARAQADPADPLREDPRSPGPRSPGHRGADLLDALGTEGTAIHLDVPARRAIEAALSSFLASGRTRVQLASTDLQLVVRLHEPPLGSAWPLQTCLREADGTVHPVAELRAVGDLSAPGAAEAAAEILRIAPTVRTAAVDDTGVDWLLTTAEASRFLTEDSYLLEAAGVSVMLPRQWTRTRASVRAEVSDADAAEQRGTRVGLAAMASFSWRLAVGDVELTEQEIKEIREAQSELVHLRGQWVRLDRSTLRAAERFLAAFGARRTRGAGGIQGAAGIQGPGGAQTQGGGPGHAVVGPPGRGPASSSDHPPVGPPVGPPEGSHPTPPDPGAAATGQLSLRDWFALLASAEAEGVSIETRRIAGEIGRLLDGDAQGAALPAPRSLRAQLRPYQQQGLDWMWFLDSRELGAILADDMGLGKTMQILALLCRERELQDPVGIGPTLLVCPMSVVGSWQREAERFAPHLRVHVHHGGDRVRGADFAEGAREVDLVLTTYSLLDRDREVLGQVPWHRLVLDEAQHVKNPATAVTRAARSLPAPRRIALTGTPVENRLADLHALMEAVNPGLLGPLSRFQDRIAGPIEQEGDEAALSRLRALTRPFLLRRVKTDRSIIADLPEKTEITQRVNLTPEQAGLYEAVVAEMMAKIDEADQNQRRAVVVSALTQLKQVCNHPAHYLGDGSGILREGSHRSGKLELVDDLLGNAFADGQKVLLFTQFTTFGHLLVPYWRERFDLDVPFLHGGVPKAQRDAMVADFQARTDQPGAMLLSLRAGGTGLTLTAANHVVHLDRWWNPAVENQATDRAFRIGQRRDVQVRKLVSAGTLEERIDQVLAEKSELADLAVAAGEGWVANLGDDALLDLVRLDRDQVGEEPESGGRG